MDGIREPFKIYEPSYLTEGYCEISPGNADRMVITAPHEGFDDFTSIIAEDLSLRFSDNPFVICDGFRTEGAFDVNRPDGKAVTQGDGSEDVATAIMFAYEDAMTAAVGRPPLLVSEIHGKGATFKGEPYDITEIALIGEDKLCGWNDDLRSQIKDAWYRATDLPAVVYDHDYPAFYGHTEYQTNGLAGINFYCGVNIEITDQQRRFFDPGVSENGSVTLSTDDILANQNEVLNALEAVLSVVEGQLLPKHW